MTPFMNFFIPFAFFLLLPHLGNSQTITSLAPNIPMGIFLAYDPAQSNYYIPITKKYLDYICQNHRSSGGPNQYIGDMVIQTLAVVDTTVSNFVNPPDPKTNDALIWEFLNPLLPYFPGGSGTCHFDRVYVGTIGLDHSKDANGNWILDALTDTNFRSNYLARQKAVAQKFADNVKLSANPNVKWEWYILPEMCMDYVNFDQYNSGTTPKYADSWADYISRHMADLNSILPGRQFLWSPRDNLYFSIQNNLFVANLIESGTESGMKNSGTCLSIRNLLLIVFDNVPEYYDPGTITYIQNSLKGMLNKIATNLAISMPSVCSTALNCPLAVAPQDHVGLGSISSAKNYTKEDALFWMNLLKPVFPFKTLTINVEQFIRNTWPHANTWPIVSDDTYNDADCIEVKLREQFYVANGFNLGPAWAINAWYSCNHPG
ncbi:C-type lectin domain-containing protein [Meloidogyne graminicola]|uniref:C-type lectin domain-containing protein n=1 Tax=Meloidogyne graminicola TaxID=189291 RepID=A0A8S9ZWP9_9BILA|nr:C-type lectin domain-containing protein [Meloidogyne graminicola]